MIYTCRSNILVYVSSRLICILYAIQHIFIYHTNNLDVNTLKALELIEVLVHHIFSQAAEYNDIIILYSRLLVLSNSVNRNSHRSHRTTKKKKKLCKKELDNHFIFIYLNVSLNILR